MSCLYYVYCVCTMFMCLYYVYHLTTGLLDLDAGRWLEARIRKVLRPATSTQVFLVFLGPRRKCWHGSHFSSKLPLHASHVALPN